MCGAPPTPPGSALPTTLLPNPPWGAGRTGRQRTDLLPGQPESTKQRPGQLVQERIEGSGKGLTREVSPKRKSPRHSGGLLFLFPSLFFSKTQNFKAERDLSSLFPISESLFLRLLTLSLSSQSLSSSFLPCTCPFNLCLVPISPPLICSLPFCVSQSLFSL